MTFKIGNVYKTNCGCTFKIDRPYVVLGGFEAICISRCINDHEYSDGEWFDFSEGMTYVFNIDGTWQGEDVNEFFCLHLKKQRGNTFLCYHKGKCSCFLENKHV